MIQNSMYRKLINNYALKESLIGRNGKSDRRKVCKITKTSVIFTSSEV